MFRNIPTTACAFAVTLKKTFDIDDGEIPKPVANKSALERCLPIQKVEASSHVDTCVYVGDRIKKAVGFPQLTACCKPLRYNDFIISYDTKNRIPNWVYEHLYYSKFFKDDPCDTRVNICPYK